MRRLISQLRTLAIAAVGALAATVAAAQPAAPEHSLLGVDCAAPPLWHCPDRACEDAVVTQEGPNVELRTRRPFFLDCPSDYRPGQKVNIVLSLHGAGSFANWQRNYFPALDVKDKYHLVIITPSSPTRIWGPVDDEYLHNMVDQVVAAVGKENVDHFILAGHSQGGLTSSRIVCTDYFKDKVDVRISLSGGRVGDVPLADKFHCGARIELPEVIDPKAGYVWDASRQDPGTDGWGHYPRSGRAKVYQFPSCADGRVVADVVRIGKGHTEGYEPNITDAIIALALSAKGGKIANGAWTPPPPPPPERLPF